MRVPLREIILSEGAGEPDLAVYDTSGPYTDPAVTIDVNKGLPRNRTAWVLERGGVEEYEGRAVKPVDNGNVSGDTGDDDLGGGWPALTTVRRRVARPEVLRRACGSAGDVIPLLYSCGKSRGRIGWPACESLIPTAVEATSRSGACAITNPASRAS